MVIPFQAVEVYLDNVVPADSQYFDQTEERERESIHVS